MTRRFAALGVLICVSSLLILAGCGTADKTIQLKGTIGWGNQPLKLKEDETLEVQLLYTGRDGVDRSAVTMCEADGSFTIEEPLPVGVELRIALIFSVHRPVSEDTTGYEDFDRNSTPLLYNTTDDPEQNIHLNLRQQTAEKK